MIVNGTNTNIMRASTITGDEIIALLERLGRVVGLSDRLSAESPNRTLISRRARPMAGAQ